MNFNFDYYAILGLSEGATEKQIEEAYTKFKDTEYETASQWQRKQKEEAYNVLKDKKTKEEYDDYRKKQGDTIQATVVVNDKKKANILPYVFVIIFLVLQFWTSLSLFLLAKDFRHFSADGIWIRHLPDVTVDKIDKIEYIKYPVEIKGATSGRTSNSWF